MSEKGSLLKKKDRPPWHKWVYGCGHNPALDIKNNESLSVIKNYMNKRFDLITPRSPKSI